VLIQYSFLIGPWSARLTIEQLDIPTIVGHGAVEPVAHVEQQISLVHVLISWFLLQQFHTFCGFWHVKSQRSFYRHIEQWFSNKFCLFMGKSLPNFWYHKIGRKTNWWKKLGSSANPSPRTHICQLMICTLWLPSKRLTTTVNLGHGWMLDLSYYLIAWCLTLLAL